MTSIRTMIARLLRAAADKIAPPTVTPQGGGGPGPTPR